MANDSDEIQIGAWIKFASFFPAAVIRKKRSFSCQNGISFDREGNLYVVNFRDNKMLKVDPKGAVAPFATISKKGLGHLCFKEDRFSVGAPALYQ
jgi:hypothetical protein